MSKGNYTLTRSYNEGDILFASDFTAENQNHITNQNPVATGAYSDSPSQYRLTTNPGEFNAEVYASSLAGEIERLRFTLAEIKSTLNGSAVVAWYTKSWTVTVPNGTITTVKLATGAVTTDKLGNGSVTNIKLAADAVTTDKILNGTITPADLDRAYATPGATSTYTGDGSATRAIGLGTLTPAISGSPIFILIVSTEGVYMARAGAAPGSLQFNVSGTTVVGAEYAAISVVGTAISITSNGNNQGNKAGVVYRVHCWF